MKRLRPRAISLGFLTDFAGTALFGGLLFALDPATSALPPEQQVAAAALSPSFFALGSFMTFVGGFVAGQMAEGEEIANAFAVGALSTFLSYLAAFESSAVPFWVQALGLLLTIPLAVAGGAVRRATRRPA